MNWLPNLIGFQIVWMASVGGAAQGWWWLGPVAVCLFASWQITVSRMRRSDVNLVLLCAVLGFALDSAWVQLGFMRFAAPEPWANFAPIWIIAMWVGFALTVNHSLSSLKRWPWAAAALGLVGGPIAYWAAARAWSAVAIEASWLPYAALGIAWALVTPALLKVADRWPAPLQGKAA